MINNIIIVVILIIVLISLAKYAKFNAVQEDFNLKIYINDNIFFEYNINNIVKNINNILLFTKTNNYDNNLIFNLEYNSYDNKIKFIILKNSYFEIKTFYQHYFLKFFVEYNNTF